MELDLTTIAAGLTIGFSGLATAWAQGKIGAAAVGAITENKEVAGIMIVLVAIPETIVILGFVIAYLMIG